MALAVSRVAAGQVFEAVGQVASGAMSEEALGELECAAMPGCGSCQGLYTANTMACITEALGMSLPGTAATPAVDAGKLRLARETGERAVGLVRAGVTPRQIVTLEAMRNAIRVDMALGGSTNTVLHLLALATEAGVPLSLETFDEVAETVPHIASMQPGGVYSMERLYRAGGIPAVFARLRSLLTDLPTVSGLSVHQIAVRALVSDDEVIRPLDNPVHAGGGLRTLRGTLAPDGAVVKAAAVPEEMWRHEGPARVSAITPAPSRGLLRHMRLAISLTQAGRCRRR
jgi:dihydroxy-acid dehydratase